MPRRLVILALAAVAVGLVAIWASGLGQALGAWAEAAQRQFQTATAGALRALKAGEPGAVWSLLGLSFAYGVVHAAGPGHGKVVIGGYGVARRVAALRLAGIALAASLAQAASAVALVGGGIVVLGWGRQQMVAATETWLAPLSYGAIGAIGLWLIWRGGRGLWRLSRPDTGAVCASCGHRHGPSAEEAGEVRSLRDALVLVAGIALRPCTGALFLLIITWRMGVFELGVAGAFAMGLGTALVTAGVALAAVGARAGTLVSLGQGTAARVALPVLECLAGAVVILAALGLLRRALGL